MWRKMWLGGSLNEKQPSWELLLLLLWERMSESVGEEVGASKPQQVGNNDRFTSPCSCMDLTSCLQTHTETLRHKHSHSRGQLRLFWRGLCSWTQVRLWKYIDSNKRWARWEHLNLKRLTEPWSDRRRLWHYFIDQKTWTDISSGFFFWTKTLKTMNPLSVCHLKLQKKVWF